jgi:hypothetical protein
MKTFTLTIVATLLIACGSTISNLSELHSDFRDPSRVCESDRDFACVVGQAIDLEVGPDLRVTKKILVSSLDGRIKEAVSKAVDKIIDRNFPGTDYQARIGGVYEIYRSSTDLEVIAYGVLGYGYGEPDYQDTILIGLDLKGTFSFEIEDNY